MSTVRAADLCRVCANPPPDKDSSMSALFDEKGNPRALAFILAKISDLPIASVDAGMPRHCCLTCKHKLEEADELRKMCQEADTKLRKMIVDEPQPRFPEVWDFKEDTVKQESSFLSEDESFGEEEPFEESASEYEEEKPKKRKYVRKLLSSKSNQDNDPDKTKKTKKHKKERKTYQCAACGHFCPNITMLKEHETTHQPDRPLQCHICPKDFARYTSFKRHLRTHEPKTESFRCEECEKTFVTDRARKEHILASHSKERPFKCKMCPKSYPRASTLWAHVQEVHNFRRPFKCEICSRGFSSRYILSRHLLTHEGKKSSHCPHCEKQYESNNYLLQHIAERHPETLETVQRCQYCGLGYSTDSHYRKHVALKHPEHLEQLVEQLKRKKERGNSAT